MSEVCPVCGWLYMESTHIPPNPSPDHRPHAPGTYYVHRWEATGNGRATIEGCSQYDNGRTDAWNPPAENTGESDS